MLGKGNIGNSFNYQPPPSQLVDSKQEDEILWAFREIADYNRLKQILESHKQANVVMISTMGSAQGLSAGGVIGLGTVNQNALLGEIAWDYWPEGTGWNYKFKIKIKMLEPKLEERCKMQDSVDLDLIKLRTLIQECQSNFIPLVPKSVTQASLTELEERVYNVLDHLISVYWSLPKQFTVKDLNDKRPIELIARLHLVAGKNIILYGPPGVGKTILAKKIVQNMAHDYKLVTGNPEWTSYDAIGGVDINGVFRRGFITDAVVACWDSLREYSKPYWVILDEINRANVDLAFGNAFTCLDASHRADTPLITFNSEQAQELAKTDPKMHEYLRATSRGDFALYVPLAFRMIGTMNNYDRALLFKLGFALMRRFAFIPVTSKPFVLQTSSDTFLKQCRSEIGSTVLDSKEVFKAAIEEMKASNHPLNDFLTLDSSIFGLINKLEFNDGYHQSLGFNFFNLINWLCDEINRVLDGHLDIGIAIRIDTFRFLISAIACMENWPTYCQALTDEALSTYVLPQLDSLSDNVRAEILGMSEGKPLTSKMNKLGELFKSFDLAKSAKIVEKILNGERVF